MKNAANVGPGTNRREAFTLIELLVVIMLTGLLVALLLPAVQAAREASRRIRCSNNFKQLGIALTSYTDRHNSFPLGYNGNGYSLHVMLLPDLEQTPLYDAVNFGALAPFVVADSSPYQTVASTRPSVFLCPSDTADDGGPFGATNYAGNGGYGLQRYGSNGLFSETGSIASKALGYASVSDGTSHTAAMGEWVRPSRRDPLALTFNTRDLQRPGEFEEFVTECRGLDAATAQVLAGKKCRWLCAGYGNSLLTFSLGPGGHSCLNAGSVNYGAFSAGSRHGRGANVLFVDGHVKYVNASISLQSWRAMSTRSGEEIIASGDN